MLKESPEFHVAELGLARSQVAMGRCEQAMARLERIRKTPSWSHNGAAVEGLCHLRSGRPEHAVVAFEESIPITLSAGTGFIRRMYS